MAFHIPFARRKKMPVEITHTEHGKGRVRLLKVAWHAYA